MHFKYIGECAFVNKRNEEERESECVTTIVTTTVTRTAMLLHRSLARAYLADGLDP